MKLKISNHFRFYVNGSRTVGCGNGQRTAFSAGPYVHARDRMANIFIKKWDEETDFLSAFNRIEHMKVCKNFPETNYN